MTAPVEDQRLYKCPVCGTEFHIEPPLTLPSGIPGLAMTPCTMCLARVLQQMGVGNLQRVPSA